MQKRSAYSPDLRSGGARATVLPALLAEIRARRDEFSASLAIPDDIIRKLKEIGLYRAIVARRFGGLEMPPAEFCRLIETISEADGSAGWVASFGVSGTYLAALPLPTLSEIYADTPDVVFAGALFPLQPARRTPQGLRVSGRWKFASGCLGASLLGVGIAIEDDAKPGLPRLAVLPREAVRIDPNWDVFGLRGTGSHDLVVENALVAEDWTLIRGGTPSLDAPLFRYPTLAFAAHVLAVVGLGVAQAALDEITALAGGRVSITGAPKLADRPHMQIELARATALLKAARAWFYDSIEAAWDTLVSGDPLSTEAVNMLRLATTHLAQTSAEVARSVYKLAGTTAIYLDNPLCRYVCDAMVVMQHAFLNGARCRAPAASCSGCRQWRAIRKAPPARLQRSVIGVAIAARQSGSATERRRFRDRTSRPPVQRISCAPKSPSPARGRRR